MLLPLNCAMRQRVRKSTGQRIPSVRVCAGACVCVCLVRNVPDVTILSTTYSSLSYFHAFLLTFYSSKGTLAQLWCWRTNLESPKAPDCTGVILEISVFTHLQFLFHFHFADNAKDPLSSVIANTSLSSIGFGRGKTCRDSFLRWAGSLTLKRVLLMFWD